MVAKQTLEKINKTKSWFFENVKKTEKSLTRISKKKNTQINEILKRKYYS